jgi:hypothetical protein
MTKWYEEFKNWVSSTFKSTDEMAAVYDFDGVEPRFYVDFMECAGGEEGMEAYRRVKKVVDQQSTLASIPSEKTTANSKRMRISHEDFKNWLNSTFKSTEEMAEMYDLSGLDPDMYEDYMDLMGGEEGMEEYRRVKPVVDQQSTRKSVPSETDESNRECNETEREPDRTGSELYEIEKEDDDESIDNENHRQYNVSCDYVRQEITIYLKIERKCSVVRFLRKIGQVNPKSFMKFMKMEGPDQGYNNLTFWGAVRYFYLEEKRNRPVTPTVR